MMNSTAETMMNYDARKKEIAVTYILWLCMGYTGAHRFYAKRIRSGLMQILLFGVSVAAVISVKESMGAINTAAAVVGVLTIVIWQCVDAFLIPGMIRSYNQAIAARMSAASPTA